MKNKLKYITAEVNEFISTERSLLIFILLFLFDICYILFLNRKDVNGNSILYVDAILDTLKAEFYIVILLLIFLFSIYTTFSHFEKNLFMIGRFKNRREYLNCLIKKVLRNTTIIFIVNLMLLLILANLRWDGTFGIHEYFNFKITNLQYLLFHFVKMFILFELLTCLFTYFIKISSLGISYIINLFVLLFSFIPRDLINLVERYISFPLIYNSYLEYYSFPNFYTEVVYSAIYICLFGIVVYILKALTLKYMKNN